MNAYKTEVMKTKEEIRIIDANIILERYRDDSQFPQMKCIVFTKQQCLDAMDAYASEATADLQKRNELLEQLVKVQNELLEFYGNNISDNAVFLAVHHCRISEADCRKGQDLRDRIADLTNQLKEK